MPNQPRASLRSSRQGVRLVPASILLVMYCAGAALTNESRLKADLHFFWVSHILFMAVARNLCAGGQARGAPVTPVSRGVWGHAPQKILKFRSPEMPFPEAISSSYLIQVMIF